MKIKIHKVLCVGASIYVLLLAFGVYFINVSTSQPKVSQQEIIQLLTQDENTDDTQSRSSKAKGFSRSLIEDDDDSAKDLLIVMNFYADDFIVQPIFQAVSYIPFQQDINTPPPKV